MVAAGGLIETEPGVISESTRRLALVNANVTPFTPHPDLWYEDGNVILQAESTGFRLFKSVLARESSVMKEVIESHQGVQLFENCPVISLNDTAEDLTVLLECIIAFQ